MGIFNRRNKGDDSPDLFDEGEESGPVIDLFTPEMLAKRLLWDIVPCPQVPGMIPLMKLNPDSPDVAEMEHRASHDRLALVVPLKEMLDLLGPIVSGITASAMLVNSGISADEEAAVALQRHHSSVLRAGMVAVLANLLDMGIITYADGVQFGE